MDVKDQTKPIIPSGHESHGVHLCHRCGWPFPKPHPSARHRRAHKKICGTIEGYTNLIDSGVVSDDEHHPDEDLEKTPSSKIEKKIIIKESGVGGIGGRSSRSEDDLFSDAVTEFSDSGTSPGLEDRSGSNKTLDRDLFFSFKDAENGGTNDSSGVNAVETLDTNVEKIEETEVTTVCDLSEAKPELPETNGKHSDDIIKNEPQSHKAESIDVVEAGEDKVKETRTSEIDKCAVAKTISEEAKDAEVQIIAESVSSLVEYDGEKEKLEKISDVSVGEKLEPAIADGISEGIKHEKIESDHELVSEVVKKSEIDQSAEGISEIKREHVSEVVKEPETDQSAEFKHEKFEFDHEHAPEVVKESGIDQDEEIKYEKFESDLDHTPEVVKESGIDKKGEEIKYEKLESDHEHAPEVVKESGIDQVEEIKHEKLESDHEHAPEGVKESGIDQGEEIKHEKLESDHEHTPEVVKESGIDQGEEIKHEKLESDHEHASEVVKESGIYQVEEIKHEKLESDHEHAPEVVEKSETDRTVSVLTEKDDLDAPESEKCSKEHTQTVLKEPNSVLTEKDDLDAPESEKCSKEHTQAVLEEPNSVSTEKDDLGAPESDKRPKEHTQEVVIKPNSVLTEKEDLDVPNFEKCSKDQTPEAIKEPKIENDSKVVEEDNHKPTNNQDSGAALSVDSSSHNSVEGNWGSVSVLSTASIDTETLHANDKSKVNPTKPVAAGSQSAAPDVFEPPSFMTLVEPKGEPDGQKPGAASSEVQQPEPEAQQAGWFPTLTKVNNESDGRKRNEEVIAKVTNWSTGKHSTPLKNLLGEAKSPSSKPAAPVVQKDEALVVNQDSSPPKLIDDGKKVRKKSWVPFVCCSSVNVVN